MKKIILSILFAVSASPSLLLAQSEYDQVTGCRLQVVGANQAADQTVGSRRTELPLREIRQRSELTTNCQLPTANCDNLGQDLSCYLMMNPEEISEAEKFLGISGKAPLSSKMSVGTTDATHFSLRSELSSVACSGEGSSTVTPIVNIAESTENQLEVIAFAKTKMAQATELVVTAKGALEAADWPMSSMWYGVLEQAEQAAKNWQKVSETLAQGKQERAALWKKAAERSDASAEEWRKVAEVCDSGDRATGESLEKTARIADCLSRAATSIAQSEELADGENQELIVLCLTIAKQYEESAEYYDQAENAKISENDTNYDGFIEAGISAYHSADLFKKALEAQEKATKAKAENQGELAVLWQKIAKQYEKSVEHKSQATKAKLNGNDTDYDRFSEIGDSFCNSASQLKKAFEALEKTIKAKEENPGELAALWQKISKQYEETAEYHCQVAKAIASGNDTDYNRFKKASTSAGNSVYQLKEASEAFNKVTKATEENQGEVVELWLRIAKQHEGSAEYYSRAAKAISSGNDVDYDRFCKVGNSVCNSSDQLKKAFTALRKAIKAKEVNQGEAVEQWQRIFKQYEKVSEYYVQAASAVISGSATDYDRFNKADHSSAWSSAYQLKEASEALEKAIQAEETNQREVAEQWKKICKKYEESAEYYCQAAKAKLSGNIVDYNRFNKASASAGNSVSRLKEASKALEKTMKAREENQGEVAERWEEIAKQYEISAEYASQAVNAVMSGNTDDYDRFHKEESSAWARAEALEQQESGEEPDISNFLEED